MKTHPAAELFPLMSEPELAELAEDIAENGLNEPIVRLDGLVLDGRNRALACERVGVTPRYVEWDGRGGSPLAFVVSANLRRRQLTPSQTAAIAAEALPMLRAEAKERLREAGRRFGDYPAKGASDQKITGTGRAVEKAGEQFGVASAQVTRADAIKKHDPELFEQIKAGEVTINAALTKTGLTRTGGDGTKPSQVHYGKGDKFDEALNPAVRYFAAWRQREFRFAHLNFKEARKRLKVLEQLAADIEEARADLAQRSEPAKLRV